MTVRVARLTAMTVAVLGVLLLVGAAFGTNVHPDANAYWLAAERLRDGGALYGGPRGDETEIYRYAPWFAFAWVPLTYLGKDGAFLAWRGILLLSTLVAVWPLLRRPSPAALTLAVLLGGLLVSNLPAANVTPLIVGALVVSLRTRAGPLILGLAGSLKVFPVLFVAGYIAERRWWAAASALAVTALLWLTLLAFDLGAYASVGGPGFYVGGVSLFGVSPWIWTPVATALTLVIAGLARARSRWTWLATAVAIPVAVPRVWLPDAGYLLTGAALVAGGRDAEP
jgi:Glycosyltransferase family 87